MLQPRSALGFDLNAFSQLLSCRGHGNNLAAVGSRGQLLESASYRSTRAVATSTSRSALGSSVTVSIYCCVRAVTETTAPPLKHWRPEGKRKDIIFYWVLQQTPVCDPLR